MVVLLHYPSSYYTREINPLVFQKISHERLFHHLGYVTTLYNVCSVHRGDTISTSGGHHEYIGGYHEYIGGYHEYIGDITRTLGDIIMHVEGYHEYIGGIS